MSKLDELIQKLNDLYHGMYGGSELSDHTLEQLAQVATLLRTGQAMYQDLDSHAGYTQGQSAWDKALGETE